MNSYLIRLATIEDNEHYAEVWVCEAEDLHKAVEKTQAQILAEDKKINEGENHAWDGWKLRIGWAKYVEIEGVEEIPAKHFEVLKYYLPVVRSTNA